MIIKKDIHIHLLYVLVSVLGIVVGVLAATADHAFSTQERESNSRATNKGERHFPATVRTAVKPYEGASQEYLDTQFRWLPEETQEKLKIRWKQLTQKLEDNCAGEYAYDSLALIAFNELVKENPGDFFEQLIQSKNLDLRGQQLEVIVAQWVQQDLGAAKKRVETLAAGSLKIQSQSLLVKAIAEKSPSTAFEMFTSSPTTYGCDLRRLFENWCSMDMEAASRASSQVNDPEIRVRALNGMVSSMAEKNIKNAWDWVSKSNSIINQEQAFSAIIHASSTKNISDILLPLNEIEDAKIKNQLFLGNLTKLANLDYKATFEFAEKNLHGENLYTALHTLTNFNKESDFGQIRGAVENLPYGEPRDKLAKLVYKSWVESDPQAAKDWVDNMDVKLPDKGDVTLQLTPIKWNF